MSLTPAPYRSKDLFEMLKRLKITSQPKMFLHRKIHAGRFVPPKFPGTNRWCFTEQQLVEIVNAFMPGGKGKWKYKP